MNKNGFLRAKIVQFRKNYIQIIHMGFSAPFFCTPTPKSSFILKNFHLNIFWTIECNKFDKSLWSLNEVLYLKLELGRQILHMKNISSIKMNFYREDSSELVSEEIEFLTFWSWSSVLKKMISVRFFNFYLIPLWSSEV